MLWSTEDFLHLAIERCFNIGNRILCLSQFEKPICMPEEYADIFREMETLGVVVKMRPSRGLPEMAGKRIGQATGDACSKNSTVSGAMHVDQTR